MIYTYCRRIVVVEVANKIVKSACYQALCFRCLNSFFILLLYLLCEYHWNLLLIVQIKCIAVYRTASAVHFVVLNSNK